MKSIKYVVKWGGGGEGGEGLHFHIKSNQLISKKLRYSLGLV